MNFTIRRETKISIKCFTKCPINFHRNNWENSILFCVNTWENNAWNNMIEYLKILTYKNYISNNTSNLVKLLHTQFRNNSTILFSLDRHRSSIFFAKNYTDFLRSVFRSKTNFRKVNRIQECWSSFFPLFSFFFFFLNIDGPRNRHQYATGNWLLIGSNNRPSK